MTAIVAIIVAIAVGVALYMAESENTGPPGPGPGAPSGGVPATRPSVPAAPSAGAPAIVASDPTTWPSGDRIWLASHAIAFAEGHDKPGSVSGRLHNPGDLSDGASRFGYEEHSGSKVTTFPDEQTGWQWLYNKLANILEGGSNVYSPDMSWRQISKLWAGDADAWVANVTNVLGVSPDSTFRQYFEA